MRSYAFYEPTIPDFKHSLMLTMGLTSGPNLPLFVLPLNCLIYIQSFNVHVWTANPQSQSVEYRAHSEFQTEFEFKDVLSGST